MESIEETEIEEKPAEKIPKTKVKPSWIKIKPDEMEKIVVELAKKGETPAKIGLILRDSYGIPKSKLFGKRISEILNEKGVGYKSEKNILEENINALRDYTRKHKHDFCASRALTKKLWKIHTYEKIA